MQRKRIQLVGAFVALVVLLGTAAALATGAPRAHQARAALVMTKRHPVTVHGTGFRARTHLRVTLFASQKQVRRALTNSRGAFTTTFSAVIDRCSGWTVMAGQPGRAAVILQGPKPECPPA